MGDKRLLGSCFPYSNAVIKTMQIIEVRTFRYNGKEIVFHRKWTLYSCVIHSIHRIVGNIG